MSPVLEMPATPPPPQTTAEEAALVLRLYDFALDFEAQGLRLDWRRVKGSLYLHLSQRVPSSVGGWPDTVLATSRAVSRTSLTYGSCDVLETEMLLMANQLLSAGCRT